MVPSVVRAKFGADSPRNEKVLGTPLFPGQALGGRGPAGSLGWLAGERAPPHRPLVPDALLAWSDSSQIWWAVAHGPK